MKLSSVSFWPETVMSVLSPQVRYEGDERTKLCYGPRAEFDPTAIRDGVPCL